jgi:hypothetical protein
MMKKWDYEGAVEENTVSRQQGISRQIAQHPMMMNTKSTKPNRIKQSEGTETNSSSRVSTLLVLRR